MADQSTQSIVINASPEQIMAVIADFEAYPQWVGAVKSVEVVEPGEPHATQVKFVLDAGVLKDEYTLAYDWSGTEKVEWHLVKGQMQKKQQGSYVLKAQGESTQVTYTLAVELNIPMLGLFKRKAEKVIMDTALKELKRRVEG